MSALKILIIEDDLVLAEELQEQLLELGYTITDNVANSKNAILAFRRKLPDVVLCDIRLEGSNQDGIELANSFNKIERVPIIFLTSFGDEKTLERAKAVNPAYYLIKPCNELQLEVALDFALSNFTSQIKADPVHSLKLQKALPCQLYSSDDFFFVKDGYKYVRVEVADVVWVEAFGANVKIVTNQFTVILTANLISFSRQINNNNLRRVHRSYIVNVNKIVAFDAGRVFVSYQEAQQGIPIGKTYRGDFQGVFPRLQSD